MIGRGERGRIRKDPSQRSEDRGRSGRGNAPPSRHLWVGNLSHNINETALCDHFTRFGVLESVSFQPGRSYAFINFQREDEAISAMRGLQGFPVAGLPLRIEFAKAEKSVMPSRGESYLQGQDDQRSRGSPYFQDSRMHHSSPDASYTDNPRMDDRSVEPSEVLWIGFPALLKVDELILRKAFSPFGEIEKITTFPGRSYAFVQFRSVSAASRAKETLQGKLFGNPRVHICFSKSERGASNSGKNAFDALSSPHLNTDGRPRSSDNFWSDINLGGFNGHPGIRSPCWKSNLESGNSDIFTLKRKGRLWTGGNSSLENRRFPEQNPELGSPENIYEHPSNATGDGGAHFGNSSKSFPQVHPLYDDLWDLPEDAFLFHGGKKLKTESFSPEKELPDYPFLDSVKEQHNFPRLSSDFRRPEALDQRIESLPVRRRQVPDLLINSIGAHEERSNHWKASLDGYQRFSGSLASKPIEGKRYAPESSLNEEWKWEGVIAKGGTPICRARCFPVGKVLDMILPEYLDCTARTGLDMLAKHYFQAAGAWVVFFVPESDADIGFYNEFLHYLEEKQRAAVAKLDDKTTLFLVPPSDFSQNVLKVPGKLSISGVVLRLENADSSVGSRQHLHEKPDTLYNPTSPSGSFPPLTSFPSFGIHGANNLSNSGTVPHAIASTPAPSNENMQGYLAQHMNSTMGPNRSHLQNSLLGMRNMPSQESKSAVDPTGQEYHAMLPNPETSSSRYSTGVSGIPSSGTGFPSHQEMKTSISAMQPEQLTQLASVLFGQQRQPGSHPILNVEENIMQTSTLNQTETPITALKQFASQNDQLGSEFSLSQYGQSQQQQQLQLQQQQRQQQALNVPNTGPRELQQAPLGNQQSQITGAQEEMDGDPQKRLQATLQLAAALLQQIQQGKGN